MIALRILLLALILAYPLDTIAATYYLSPSGSDAYSTAQAQSSSTPWKSFLKAFTSMAAGDTLILRNGTYSIAAGTGCMNFEGTGSAQIPSGSSRSARTIVQAENPGMAIVSGAGSYENTAVFIGRSYESHNYIKVAGIKTLGDVNIYNGDYNYIKDVGVIGMFGSGSNDHTMSSDYNLFEDCWITTNLGRIVGGIYEGRYNTLRRVVIRADGCTESDCLGGSPNVGVTVYNSQYNSLQNVIVIDRILGTGVYNDGGGYGDFATAMHSGGSNDYPNVGNKWLGCMSINSPDSGFNFEADTYGDGTWSVQNSVAWDSIDAGFNAQSGASSVLLDHFTSGVAEQAVRIRDITGTFRNSICYDSTTYAVNMNSIGTITHINAYDAPDLYESDTCTTGCLTTNPRTTALKHLTRIEDSSSLDGTASDSLDYGATITHRYGVDGTIYGDAGHETLQTGDANNLWPWPNEDRIKADFAAVSGGARGFATGNSMDATPQTLTKYIWEYLGTQIPSDIYGAGGDTTPATTTITSSDPLNITASSATVIATCADETAVSGSKWAIGVNPDATHGTSCTGTTSASCSVTGLSSGNNDVRVACYDTSGNYDASPGTLTVNYTPPAVTAGLSGASLSGGKLTQ